MIELEKVLAVLDTDEGKLLVAEYTERFLKLELPEYVNDDAVAAGIVASVAKGLSESTVPEGADVHQYILGKLEENIAELKSSETAPESSEPIPTITENIPPRPLPNGSRYLNPEEVNWLLKYDPKVKSAAEKGAKGFRRQYPDKCSYMSDDMIIENILNMLYKLNRRDPEIISQLSAPPGPSFFKEYEEGTPEEIVIRYFNSYSGREKDYEKPKTTYSGSKTTTSKHTSTSSRKAELLEQKKHNQTLGIIFLLVFWPIGVYYLYKASQISKQIDSL